MRLHDFCCPVLVGRVIFKVHCKSRDDICVGPKILSKTDLQKVRLKIVSLINSLVALFYKVLCMSCGNMALIRAENTNTELYLAME